jgi:hypothetical protein
MSYHDNFDLAPVTAFAELVHAVKPGATGKDLVELLDGRAERTRALHWRAGRRGPPQWAIDLLIAKLTAQHARQLAIAAKAKPGRGLKAGAKNLAIYLQKKSRATKPGSE